MNHTKKNKLPLYIGIPVILLLIFLRFGLYFLKSDGFSGLSMLLPILLLCFILFALCTCGFFAAWVYQDCKKRGDDPVLWAIVVFIATPSAPFRDKSNVSCLRASNFIESKIL